MTTQQLESNLTDDLKDYLKSQGHVKTGKLMNSIKVNVTDAGKFKMTVVGLEYLEFLDEGGFVQSFFDLGSTISLMEDYLASQLENDFGE